MVTVILVTFPCSFPFYALETRTAKSRTVTGPTLMGLRTAPGIEMKEIGEGTLIMMRGGGWKDGKDRRNDSIS